MDSVNAEVKPVFQTDGMVEMRCGLAEPVQSPVSAVISTPPISRSLWFDLVEIANSQRPHDRVTWIAHRAVFQGWLNTPLREQAAQLRQFLVLCPLTAGAFRSEDWECLVPAGEMEMSCELFMLDLASFFRVLSVRNQAVVPGTLQTLAETIGFHLVAPIPCWQG